jgi:Mg-chelatase subunit ChlI
LRRELDEARRHSGDFDREAFIAWFERKQGERAHLADAIRDARSSTATARSVLARRRVAETACEEALASAMAARAAVVAHREQVVLEDVSRALKHASERDPG